MKNAQSTGDREVLEFDFGVRVYPPALYDASGCRPVGRDRCDTTTTWSLAGGWPSQPFVRSN